MEDYTAEEGLCILRYLDMDELDPGEEVIFKNRWDEVYRHQKDPILAARLIYVNHLPFICNIEKGVAQAISDERGIEFDARLKESKLKDMIKLGSSLKDILIFCDKIRPFN